MAYQEDYYTEMGRILAEAWHVPSVQLTGCGCDDPKAMLRLVPVERGQAQLRWVQCSNCWGWPCVTVNSPA